MPALKQSRFAASQIGCHFFCVTHGKDMPVRWAVIRWARLFLTHADVAPAINQTGGRETAGSAPRFSKTCIVAESFTPSDRTRLAREAHRDAYDRETTSQTSAEGLA